MQTGFILTAVVIIALGLYAALWPLMRSGNNVLKHGVAALALGALVASIYMMVGNPTALNPRLALPATNMADAIEQLKARVAAKPDDAKAWLLLAQAQLTTGQSGQVELSLNNAIKAAPDDADILTQAAEVLALKQNDNQIPDLAMQWLTRAVQINPQHQRARWFLGIAQRQRDDNAAAAKTWEPLLAILDRSAGEALLPEVNAARAASGLSPLTDSALQEIPPEAVTVTVHLDDALRSQLPPESIVFVTAKENGQGMPLAVKRYAPSNLPRKMYLTDADAAMPTAKLSSAKDVRISAKISLSGSATPDDSDVHSSEVKPDSNRHASLELGAAKP